MIYLLLNNGRGLLRSEIVALESKELRVSFADEYANLSGNLTVQIALDDRCIIKSLPDNECVVELGDDYEGSVTITVIADDKQWVCDPLYVGRRKNGKIYVTAKTSYGDEIARLQDELEKKSEKIEALETRLEQLEKKYEYVETGHYLI